MFQSKTKQKVLQHSIYSYIFNDRYMLWLLKMAAIGVYTKVGKTQYLKLKLIA